VAPVEAPLRRRLPSALSTPPHAAARSSWVPPWCRPDLDGPRRLAAARRRAARGVGAARRYSPGDGDRRQ
jgi:hypothetical protein